MSSSSQNPKMYSAIERFPEKEPVPEPFVNNIKAFISEFCKRENYQSVGFTSSFTYLVNKRGAVIPLYVFQEDIEKVRNPVCHQCNLSGWGSNIRSRARFHFVIPSPEKWDKPIEPDVLECKNHVMHGFIHSNGFGHILTIKGSDDGGSEHIDIDELKKLWDRICCSVHARAISVEDNSTNRGMVSRLLYAIVHGPEWTGYGGYRVHFPNENVALKQRYVDSVERLQTTKLESPDMIEIAKKYHVATPTPQNLFRKLIYLVKSEPESVAKTIYDDLIKIYDHVSRLEEVRTVLQSKVLIKTFHFENYKVGNASNHVCEYEKLEVDLDLTSVFTNEGIHVVLPRDKTVGEIKEIIQETWRSVYTVTENLVVSEISGFEGDNTIYIQDDASKVIVRGPVFGDEKIPLSMSYEGGYVKCAICTQGHRDGQLIQCQKCKILGHRKCYGIRDKENMPMYLCKVCHNPLLA